MCTIKKITLGNTLLFALFMAFYSSPTAPKGLGVPLLIFFIFSYLLSKFFSLSILRERKYLREEKERIVKLYDERLRLLNTQSQNTLYYTKKVFSLLKEDMLEFIVRESELKKREEESHKLSDELLEFNKNLENLIKERTLELSKSKEMAEVANKTKSEFLAKISHEMRTPLTPIIGYSKLLNEKDYSREISRKYLDVIHNSGIKLLNFTNELLDFSKIEAGKVDLEMGPFDLKILLEEIYLEQKDIAFEKGINFHMDIPRNKTMVVSDKMKIYEILKNLIHNGIKYTNNGGVVCEYRYDDEKLYFKIFDTGIGIKKDDLEGIFQSFRQVNTSSKGVGLGLSITKKLVDVLKGRIRVNSQIEVGTSFHVEIPIEHMTMVDTSFSKSFEKLIRSNTAITPILLKAVLRLPLRTDEYSRLLNSGDLQEMKSLNHKLYGIYSNLNLTPISDILQDNQRILNSLEFNTSHISRNLKKIRELIDTLDYRTIFERYAEIKERRVSLLLAEDMEENRELIVAILSSEHVDIHTASDGEEALMRIRKHIYDLVLMDIQMPIMDGLEALRRIRENESIRHLNIIALTAQAIVGDREKLLSLGFDGYLSKPIDKPLLYSYLEKIFN